MQQYEDILKELEKKLAPKVLKQYGIICKKLPFGDCSPIYLAKPHWTNRFDDDRKSTLGIFCSVWVDPKYLKRNLYSYNIHAKTLHKLPGYQLKPKLFATEFRSLVNTTVADWPGVSLNYGPSTLLMGRDSCDLDSFAEKVEARIQGYVDIHKHIDELLAQYRSGSDHHNYMKHK